MTYMPPNVTQLHSIPRPGRAARSQTVKHQTRATALDYREEHADGMLEHTIITTIITAADLVPMRVA